MSVANSASVVGERESLLSLGLPWRSYVARLECQGQGADTALEAALRELGPEEGRDPAATRVVILTRAHLQSVVNAHKLRGKVPLVEGLLKQIELDKQLGLGARADAAEAAAAAQLEREQAAEKRRKKRHRHGDGHDDDDDDARPDDDAAPAAPRAAPDAVYILRDYPATLEEASDLVKHCTKEGAPKPLLDAVVTVVANDDGGPGGGVTWPVPARPCMAFDFLPLAGDLAFGDAAAEDEASAASASAKKKKKAKKAKKKPPPEKPADPPPDDHGAPPAEVAETLEQTSVVTAEPSVEDSASAASPARDAAAAAPPPANRAQAVKLDVARALRASTEQSHRRALGAAAGKPKATPPEFVGALFDASRKQGGVWGDVPVPIAKGGERVRVRVALPDGGRVATTYDTSVTATTRGRLALLRPDCTEVVADDAGCCVFRPPELWSGGSIKVRGEKFVYGSRAPRAEGADDVDEEDETRSEPDATCGAFVFDCVGGALRVEDPEFNCFAAHLCGPRAAAPNSTAGAGGPDQT